VHVTQEGPDALSHDCPVQAFGPVEPSARRRTRRTGMERARTRTCTSRPLSTNMIGPWQAGASRRRGTATSRCLPGCEGHSKLEAIRCLKRYIARELFALIRQRGREINQGPIAA
jgi:hypothetical protein